MNSSTQSDRAELQLTRWGIVIVLLAFIGLAFVYSAVNPLHEATDELRHYRFVRIIATIGKLPIQGQESCRSQSHHPPLFYALGALATFWIDTSRDICYTPPENPFWAYRYWDVGQDNKNQYLHGLDESFPWHGEALAVHIVRAINVLIGVGVVWLTWATARLIWPRSAAMALGATAFVAFNPMFLYMSGGINNDVIASFSGAAIVYACVRLLCEPESLNWRWGLAFGALYGLALLSKFNLAPIFILVAAAVAYAARQTARSGSAVGNGPGSASEKPKAPWSQLLRLWLPAMLLTILVAGLVAGWWFVRNQMLFGEPTGFRELTELWGVRNPTESLGLAISELPYAWTTLWGRFGFGQIPLPQAIYNGLKIVVTAGLIGAVFGFFRLGARLRVVFLLLAANLLIFSAVLFNYMLVSPAGPNGRFVFPALSSLAILVFYGLSWWLLTLRKAIAGRMAKGKTAEGRGQSSINILAIVTVCSMLALSIWVLVGYLAPAYARPPTLAADATIPNPVDARFDNLVTLLGYDVSATTLKPGEPLDVELYWQVDAQPPGNYLLFLHLIDEAGTMVAQRDTHPGLGNFPSSLWRPGDRFVERVRMQLPETAYAPETAALSVGLYAPEGYRLAVSDAQGNEAGDALHLTKIAIDPGEGQIPNPQAHDFANDILLAGYDYDRRVLSAGDALEVTLYWQALRDVAEDYIIQLRLLDVVGREVAAVEERPRSGELPTDTWLEGAMVEDSHLLQLPDDTVPGRYQVDLIVIDASSGETVHILAEDGHQVSSYLPLAEVRVEP